MRERNKASCLPESAVPQTKSIENNSSRDESACVAERIETSFNSAPTAAVLDCKAISCARVNQRLDFAQLMRYDLRRFFGSTSFKACMIVGIVLVLLGSVIDFLAYIFADDFNGILSLLYTPEMAEQIAVERPTNADLFSCLSASGLPILLATIAVTNFIASEFSASTMHNLIAKGFGRTGIYLSKLLTSFIGAIIMSLFLGVLSIGLQLAFFGLDETEILISQVLRFILMNTLSYAAYCAIFTSLGMMFKSGAATMTVNILLMTMSSLVFALFDIPLSPFGISVSRFWIVTFSGNMLHYGFGDTALINALIGEPCYIVFFTLLGLLVFNKSDIK